MSISKTVDTVRRSLFFKGGVALGAGIASATAGAATLLDSKAQDQLGALQQHLATLADKEAVRQLLLAYTTLVEKQSFAVVAQLFTSDAVVNLHGVEVKGRAALQRLFGEHYAQQSLDELHTAFRLDQREQHKVSVSGNGKSASAVFNVQVETSQPFPEGSSLVAMARLQGQYAASGWQQGRFTADYARIDGQWRIRSLKYQQA